MEKPQLNNLETSYYTDQRRQQGIARLAIYAAFEDSMAMAARGELTRDAAIERVRMIRPHILEHMGIVEVAE